MYTYINDSRIFKNARETFHNDVSVSRISCAQMRVSDAFKADAREIPVTCRILSVPSFVELLKSGNPTASSFLMGN